MKFTIHTFLKPLTKSQGKKTKTKVLHVMIHCNNIPLNMDPLLIFFLYISQFIKLKCLFKFICLHYRFFYCELVTVVTRTPLMIHQPPYDEAILC